MLQVAVTNPIKTPMDSLWVRYTIKGSNNDLYTTVVHHPPIGAMETLVTNFTFPTVGLSGEYVLTVELNPDGQQPEKFGFNNVMYLPFTVVSEKINPILDVTFNGRHLTENEVVNPKPSIVVKIRDENPYLA